MKNPACREALPSPDRCNTLRWTSRRAARSDVRCRCYFSPLLVSLYCGCYRGGLVTLETCRYVFRQDIRLPPLAVASSSIGVYDLTKRVTSAVARRLHCSLLAGGRREGHHRYPGIQEDDASTQGAREINCFLPPRVYLIF